MSKKIISAVLAVCMVFGSASLLPKSGFAQDTGITASAEVSNREHISGDYYYYLSEQNNGLYANLHKYNGNEKNVVVPEKIDGYPVRGIQTDCFKNNQTMETVKIPEGIRSVGYHAFDSCEKLKSAILPSSLKTVFFDAFYKCTNLKNVVLPEGIVEIYCQSFTDLKELNIPASVEKINGIESGMGTTKFNVAAGNKYYSSLDGVLYNKDKTQLLRCPRTVTQVTIPKSVNTIASHAFYECAGLRSLVVPGTVRTIGKFAFRLSQLNDIILEDGIQKIERGAFWNVKLRAVIIPESVETIDDEAFSDTLTEFASKDTVILGTAGSEAEAFAKRTGMKFIDLERRAGKDRYQTSAMISRTGFRTAETVVLASGEKYADALAGVPLAYELSAPVLLTSRNALSANSLYEILRLDAKKVIILGGTGAVSESVEKELSKNGIKTERIAGADRFETAVKVGQRIDKEKNKKPRTVFFVSAGSFADALSASAPASLNESPIIFLQKEGIIDKATMDYLRENRDSIEKAYIIGGSGVISEDMKKSVSGLINVEPQRISGVDRYETCLKVNEAFSSTLTGSSLCIAKGLDFPDALSGGLLAALRKSPLMLADGNDLTQEQRTFMDGKKITALYVFGGTSAVSDTLVRMIGKEFYLT